MRIDILKTYGKDLHDRIILLRGEVCANKAATFYFLKYLYQARRVSGYV